MCGAVAPRPAGRQCNPYICDICLPLATLLEFV